MPRNTDVLVTANRLSRGLVDDTWRREDIHYIMDVLEGNEVLSARVLIEHSTANKVFRLQMLADNLKSFVAKRNGKRTPPIVLEMNTLMSKLQKVIETTLSEYRILMVAPTRVEKVVLSLENIQKLKTKKGLK